jgi:hypothetical protein
MVLFSLGLVLISGPGGDDVLKRCELKSAVKAVISCLKMRMRIEQIPTTMERTADDEKVLIESRKLIEV